VRQAVTQAVNKLRDSLRLVASRRKVGRKYKLGLIRHGGQMLGREVKIAVVAALR
jgi:hypothetical protein